MSISQVLFRRRTAAFEVTIYNEAGTIVPFDAAVDKFRVKIGRAGSTPILDLVSGTTTASGSTVAAANPSGIKIDQSDINVTPGIYDIEAAIVDNSDADRIKIGDKGIVLIVDTANGDIT